MIQNMKNVLNALAAVAVAHELNLDDRALRKALVEFAGIDRRLQIIGEEQTKAGKVLFVDDYGHHPTEIAATLDAVRQAWPDRRHVVVFQCKVSSLWNCLRRSTLALGNSRLGDIAKVICKK